MENGKNGHQQPHGKKWDLKKIRYTDFFPVFCIGSIDCQSKWNNGKSHSILVLIQAVRKRKCATLSAKKFQNHFFGLFSPVMDAESRITPWKTVLDDLRGVQGVWDQKMSKISKWFFGHFLARNE